MKPIVKKIALHSALSLSLLPPLAYKASLGVIHTKEYLEDRTSEASDFLFEKLGYERPPIAISPLSLEEIVTKESAASGLSPALLKSVIYAESAGNPLAISPKGALGLMQLMPATAALYGTRGIAILDPETNIATGAKHLAVLLKKRQGALSVALQEYNGGAGCIDHCPESIAYAKKVINLMALNVPGGSDHTSAQPVRKRS